MTHVSKKTQNTQHILRQTDHQTIGLPLRRDHLARRAAGRPHSPVLGVWQALAPARSHPQMLP